MSDQVRADVIRTLQEICGLSAEMATQAVDASERAARRTERTRK